MAYANTGKALATRWDYVVGGVTKSQKLLNTAGVEMDPADIYLLTDTEYTECFKYTVNYMRETLKWTEYPSISTSIKTDLVLCPVPSNTLLRALPSKTLEVKYETYETGNRKYRIFFACEEEVPTDLQVRVTCVSPYEVRTIPVSSSVLSAGNLTYQFTFTDGTTKKAVGDYEYILSPASVTLPNIL